MLIPKRELLHEELEVELKRSLGLVKEFREFAIKGNVVDMAVGIVIGGAFATIAKSLVDDIVMPPIGLLLGNVDFNNRFLVLREGIKAPPPYPTLQAANQAGAVTLNYGRFAGNIFTFLLVAWAVFILVKSINRVRRQEQVESQVPTNRSCPYCTSSISMLATRCPQCTSTLDALTT